VLRALGYPKSFLLKWLVWEGLLLGVSACLLGALVDAALFSWLRDLFGAALPSADLIPSSILQSYPVWAAALFTTTAAVFFPMWRLSRQSVHESLRS
jgi:ABC-type lipoprotein release transport system permease subunit